MARTTIALQEIATNGGALANTLYSATDSVNGMEFANNGNVLLQVKNGSGSSITATVTSVADEYGRTGDQVVTVTAGNTASIGPFKPGLFNQRGAADLGKVFVTISSATSVTIAALKLNP